MKPAVGAASESVRRRVEVMLDRYAQQLIRAAAEEAPEGDANKTEILLALLDKSEALGADAVFIRLLEQFGQQLQLECHLRRVDALFATVLAHDTLSAAQRVAFTDLRLRVLVQLGERELARQMLAAVWPAATTPLLQARLYNRQGYLLAEYEEFEAAQQAFQNGIQHAEACGDVALISLIHNNSGELYYRQEQEDLALAQFAKAIAYAEQIDRPFLRALAEGGMAMTLDALGQFDAAILHHERARRYYQVSGDRFGEVRVDLNLAYNAYRRQDYEGMKGLAENALSQARMLGDMDRIAFAYHRLGQAHTGLKCYELAAAYYKNAIELRVLIGKPTYVRTTAQNILRLIEVAESDDHFPNSEKLNLRQRCQEMLKAADVDSSAAFV